MSYYKLLGIDHSSAELGSFSSSISTFLSRDREYESSRIWIWLRCKGHGQPAEPYGGWGKALRCGTEGTWCSYSVLSAETSGPVMLLDPETSCELFHLPLLRRPPPPSPLFSLQLCSSISREIIVSLKSAYSSNGWILPQGFLLLVNLN